VRQVDHVFEVLKVLDRWLAENNHHGILSSAYAHKGIGQPYMAVEGGPAGFVKWYMRDVVTTENA